MNGTERLGHHQAAEAEPGVSKDQKVMMIGLSQSLAWDGTQLTVGLKVSASASP